VEKIAPRASLELTNDLDISLRQKEGFELSWVSISPGAISESVILSPDCTVSAGTYPLTLESTDLNSPLATATVLKTDVI